MLETMDTIEIIILTAVITALANGTVIGILVYRIQKKFEATIQTSLFEHQTKFSRNYEESVEALEILSQKFVVFSDGFITIAFEGKFFLKYGKLDIEVDVFERNSQQLVEWVKSFEENQLFLPSRINLELQRICMNVALLQDLLSYALPFFNSSNDDLTKELNHKNNLLEMSKMNINQIDLEKPDFNLLLSEIIHEMIAQRLKLENFYKSVADIQG